MKSLNFSNTNKVVAASLSFTLFFLLVRICYTGTMIYSFYPWNLLLAVVPLFFSEVLQKQQSINIKSVLLMICWLLFLPNAPYLLTDIFHFEARPFVPAWFDLLLVISGAWNGLLICMISLLQVEKFIRLHIKPVFSTVIIFVLLFLCGYGVYIGRYLRYNSWSVITQPGLIVKSSSHHLYHPYQSLNVWLFTVMFAGFLNLVYFTIKKLPAIFNNGQQQIDITAL